MLVARYIRSLSTHVQLIAPFVIFGVFLVSSQRSLLAENAQIWDNGASTFTDTFADGDTIDNGTANAPGNNTNVVTDSQGNVYVGFRQSDGTSFRLYLVRYNRTDAAIWDNGTSTFTDTFANGDPVDNGTANDVLANGLVMAVDSEDRVYLGFVQSNGANNRLYLTRYDGTDVKIWDNDTSSFTDTFANGDPIDNGTASSVYGAGGEFNPLDIEIDGQDRVYISFAQDQGGQDRLYLTRFDGTDVKIWDNGASAFTDTFTDGDPIDNGTANALEGVNLVSDQNGLVYIPFVQSDGTNTRLFLTRFDGTDVKIWDNGTSAFTDTFTSGDPIDNGTTENVAPSFWDPVVDSNGQFYVAFSQNTSGVNRLYLTRYDGTDVTIWDNGASTFTDTFTNGDPIDAATGSPVLPQIYNLAIDFSDRVYIPILQSDGANARLYLARFDGSDVGIWDNDTDLFTDTFTNADPIDRGGGSILGNATITAIVDASERLYLLYAQDNGTNVRLYLTRHTGTTAGIWDEDTNTFTDTFVNGDPIDDGVASSIGSAYKSSHGALSGDTGELFYAFEKSSEIFLGRVSGIPLAPVMNVVGNGRTINDGDTTPRGADHTNFGSGEVDSDTISRTYTIQNIGEVALTFPATPRVSLSGTNAADFTVTTQPSASVAANGSTTFVVRFDPSATGVRAATVSITNNDTDKNPYNFNIQGTGTDPDLDGDGIPNSTDTDDDNDGVTDAQEALDGTNADDSGSFVLVLPTTFCSEWNGFLGMLNINEYANATSSLRNFSVTLYDLAGTEQSDTASSVFARSQRDLLVHDLLGFTADSYGRTCTTLQNGSAGDIDGRTVFYHPSGASFDFVFAIPFNSSQSGSQFVPLNTSNPSLNFSSNFVANWISVTSDSTTTQTGTVIFYERDGSELGSEEVTIEAGGRRDFSGHQFGSFTQGLVEWRPDSITERFVLRNIRYFYDNPQATPTFESAVHIEGLHGTGEEIWLPLDTRNGSAIVELSNSTNANITVDVTFRSSTGATEDTQAIGLPPYGTIHLVADEILSTEIGSATIDGSSTGSVIAVGMHYSRDAELSLVNSYAVLAREPNGSALRSSYNTFLGQSCDLLLVNSTAGSVISSISLTRYDGSTIAGVPSVLTPARGVTNFDLCANDTADSYGSVTVTPGVTDSLVGTVVRRGAQSRYQFATELRQ